VKTLDKQLELALAQIDKQYGVGTIIARGDFIDRKVKVIPTTNVHLDKALGIGGLPRGRITEIFGTEGLGKSLLALCVAAEAQKMGLTVAYIDAEHDLDPEWAAFLGMNIDDVLLCQPDYGEQGLEIAHTLIKTGKVHLIIIDSVAALTPKSELEGTMEDMQVGAQARMMAKALRKMRPDINHNDVCALFLNQVRDKIGFMQSGVQSPGGRALRFGASVRIELKRLGDYKEGAEVVGTRVQAKVIKNKVAAPHKVAEYNIIDGVGFDNYSIIALQAVEVGILIRKGTWLYWPALDDNNQIVKGLTIGNGMRQVREKWINEDPAEYAKIIELLDMYNNPPPLSEEVPKETIVGEANA
jgi:recombination protein RecA